MMAARRACVAALLFALNFAQDPSAKSRMLSRG